jgi:hypothetical protein
MSFGHLIELVVANDDVRSKPRLANMTKDISAVRWQKAPNIGL